MADHLPSLSALRAFDAAARHLSVTAAAAELHLTHGAVSHQIKHLESELGHALFQREGRRIALTPAGYVFSLKLRPILHQLEQVVSEVRTSQRAPGLRMTVLPSFAARWLLPRLPDFMQRHPDLPVTLHASLDRVDLNSEQMDLAIRYGSGDWPDVHATRFLDDQILPLCSPDYPGCKRWRQPAQWLDQRLMRDEHYHWRPWFAANGISVREPRDAMVFNDSGMLIQSAVAGQGIALGRSVLASDDLLAGRLTVLPGATLPAKFSYYVVTPVTPRQPQALALFIDWLQQQAQQTEHALAAHLAKYSQASR